MTRVQVSRMLTGPDGGDVEVEIELEMHDGEAARISLVEVRWIIETQEGWMVSTEFMSRPPRWMLEQLDMQDLGEEALRKLEARERGWP